ncbi:hypothetical protein [Streptomyces cyaneofuscatus]|uniref:hypothetical protein n=1 Tax=Streptomyces cyaneofuscatus TaxID=66883 RepID=UPI00342BCAC7
MEIFGESAKKKKRIDDLMVTANQYLFFFSLSGEPTGSRSRFAEEFARSGGTALAAMAAWGVTVPEPGRAAP